MSEGRRSEFKAFGWDPEQVPDPQDPATFRRSKLRWSEMSEESHASVLKWYKNLIAMRRSRPGLTDGRMDRVEVSFDEGARWLAVRREDVEVICNFASDRQAIAVRSAKPPVLASVEDWQLRPGLVELAGDSVAVFTG